MIAPTYSLWTERTSRNERPVYIRANAKLLSSRGRDYLPTTYFRPILPSAVINNINLLSKTWRHGKRLDSFRGSDSD